MRYGVVVLLWSRGGGGWGVSRFSSCLVGECVESCACEEGVEDS